MLEWWNVWNVSHHRPVQRTAIDVIRSLCEGYRTIDAWWNGVGIYLELLEVQEEIGLGG